VTLAVRALLFVAAAVGGALNSVAGGGSFVAFPALLFAGVPPIPANATNTIALWPASVASAVAYRRELTDARRVLVPLGCAALGGGLVGSLLLLRTSDQTFVVLIPFLLLFATVLFSFGGSIAKKITAGAHAPLPVAVAAQFAISVYGGYFGGGMGIMMLAVMTLLGMTEIHRMNGLKNVLGTLINGVAVVAFVLAGAVQWGAGVVMIFGGITGGYAGAAIARRVNPRYVRRLVMAIAWTMTAYFFAKTFVLAPAAHSSRISRELPSTNADHSAHRVAIADEGTASS
jgi:uncharacterized membrane protein YfcA